MSNQEMSYDTKTIISALALLVLYPLGLILMWRWKVWSLTVRWWITIPPVLVLVIAFIFIMVSYSAVSEL